MPENPDAGSTISSPIRISSRLDTAERVVLLREGQHVSLTPKAFDLLVYLVDHAGRLATNRS